jgi:hypothetical protein
MNDPMDFVKNLWGSMSVPGMGAFPSMAPAMSVEDLDKKIADLKAVETWLNMNMSMLRGTIQTLEVQRGTMVTLKSMGAALAAAVKQPDAGANAGANAAAPLPYASFFGQPSAESWPPSAKSPPKAEQRAEPRAEPKAQGQAEAPKDPLPAAAAAAMTNPAAWWNMLQDQFKAAVSTAMSPEAVASASARAQEAAAAMSAAAARPAQELQKEMQKALDKPADKHDAKRAPARKAAKPKDEGGA